MAHDVFISHSPEDKLKADALCSTLESRRIRCWIAPRGVRPGADYAEALLDAISGSKAFILVLSKNSNQSRYVWREVERTVIKGIPIIPFRISRTYRFRSQWVFRKLATLA